MPGQNWDADMPTLVALVAEDADLDTMCEALPHRTRDAIRFKLKRFDGTAEIEGSHPIPDLGVAPKEPVDIMGTVDRIIRRHDTYEKNPDKDYARVVIETDEPIAVMYSADWHFGGIDVDYRAYRTHLHFLLNMPRFYMQLVGDALNIAITHRVASARTDMMTPDEQAEFLRAFIREMVGKGKLLSVTDGNHDVEFTERSSGLSLIKLLAEKSVPHFRGLGYCDLVLRNSKGEEFVYPVGLVHKTRFHSFMNQLHGNKRMQQLSSEFFGPTRPLPRVFVTAHTHNPALMTEGLVPEDRVVHVKCGTYKTDCKYSQRYFGQGKIGVPTVVFHADRFEMVGLPTPQIAYRYMTGEDWEGGEA